MSEREPSDLITRWTSETSWFARASLMSTSLSACGTPDITPFIANDDGILQLICLPAICFGQVSVGRLAAWCR